MRNKEKNFISVVVYVYNAENRIEKFLSAITEQINNNFEYFEIICVNDASGDRSIEKIKRLSKEKLGINITLINMSHFQGVELAMNAGVDIAIGDFVFEFDNTFLDFKPEVLMEVYHHLLKGYDIVSASAKGKERLTSRLFYKFFEQHSNGLAQMTTESFRLISRRAINRIKSINKTIPYRKVIYINCGLKTDNIRYDVTDSVIINQDRKEKRFRLELAVNSLLLFTQIGYRFASTMTVIMMLISIFMILYSITIYFTLKPIVGWTTTILFLSVAFFGLFGILTFVIKYLHLLLDLVFKKEPYNFESVEKIIGE